MKARATVIDTDGKTARVVSKRSSACSACHNCENSGACHAELVFGSQTQDVEITAKNSIGAKAGDEVELESSTFKTLGAAFSVFIVPVVIAVIGYLCASALGCLQGISATVMLCAFVLSFFVMSKITASFVKRSLNTYIVKILEESDR